RSGHGTPEPRGILAGSEDEEGAAPGEGDADALAVTLGDQPQGVLARAVEGRGETWRRGLAAYGVVPPFVFGAGATDRRALTAVVGEAAQQPQARLHPAQVLRRCPERSRLRVPGEVEKMRRGDCRHQRV